MKTSVQGQNPRKLRLLYQMSNFKNYGGQRKYCHGLPENIFSLTMIISACFMNLSVVWQFCEMYTFVCPVIYLSLFLSVFFFFSCSQKCITYKKSRSIHKRIKIGLFRFFGKFCYLNFLEMILSGRFYSFYFPVANSPHIQENSCDNACPKTFSTNQIVGFFKLQYPKKQSDCRIF